MVKFKERGIKKEISMRIGIDCDGVVRDFIPDVINLIKE